jgi:hypothetical protein
MTSRFGDPSTFRDHLRKRTHKDDPRMADSSWSIRSAKQPVVVTTVNWTRLTADAAGIVVPSVDVSGVESLTHSVTTAQLDMLELSVNQVDLARGNKSKRAKYNIV